jgi:hypothetical protein
VQLLLGNGANIDAKGKLKNIMLTPLQAATVKGHDAVMELLETITIGAVG